MEHAQFERLKIQVSAVSAEQTLELEDEIQGIISHRVAEIALARRTRQTLEARICPHCKSNDSALHGKDQNGRRRFKCRGCCKTYNILTGTPMARARKPEKWGQYLCCMTEHMSVRKIVASGIGVHQVTAWRWRHRFLKAAANDNAAVLSGVVEADTTFFRQSFKGSRGGGMDEPMESGVARARVSVAAKRDASRREVPVLTALDSGGAVFDAILASLTDIGPALNGRIGAGSVFCSDASAAYVTVAEKAGAHHYAVFVPASAPNASQVNLGSTPVREPQRLGLRRVNNHHHRLKYLVNERCRGVATKYLWHYLGWHRAMVRPGFQGTMLLARALR